MYPRIFVPLLSFTNKPAMDRIRVFTMIAQRSARKLLLLVNIKKTPGPKRSRSPASWGILWNDTSGRTVDGNHGTYFFSEIEGRSPPVERSNSKHGFIHPSITIAKNRQSILV